MKCKYVITLVLAMLVLNARAQYDPSFSHYFDMEPSFNAASVGKETKLNITAAYAIQMAGFERCPQTIYVGADIPFYFLKAFHGAGLQFMNDQIGLFKHMRIEAQYAGKFNLFGGQMSIGIQAGLLNESFDGSKIDIEDPSDPAFTKSQVTGNQIDLSAGLYYKRGPFYIGASVQHINAPTIELGETNELKIDRTYYFTAGYNIKLRNPFLTIKPSVMFKSDLAGYRGDITCRLVYTNEKKMMYLGVNYSPMNSVTLLVGGNIQGIFLGYSYEFYTGGISLINGTHELCIGYQMDINLTKKGRNKHQSVRIL